MTIRKTSALATAYLLSVAAVLLIAGCGGSGSGGTTTSSPAGPAETGTVGLIFTDKPTEDFSAIRLNVIKAVLIGDDGQETLFDGEKSIDLLNLTNFNEPIIFGEVRAGMYTKLRLVIDDLELVPHDSGNSIFPSLPANGKIDLLDPSGIPVLPGRNLLIEIDMDANKSIKITGAGNSGKYQFRPVVKASFMDGGLPEKLARVAGVVSEIFDDSAGSFLLCDIETPTSCLTVNTADGTCLFDNEGLPTSFAGLAVDDQVVVVGSYQHDLEIELNALIIEIGGNAEQVKGTVVSTPVDGSFLLLMNDGTEIVVELQDGTKFFDADGEIGPGSIVLGVDIEVEGVQPTKANAEDPDIVRAALIFVEGEQDEQLSGTIIEPVDADTRSFGLTPADSSDTCVRVNDDAAVLLVDVAAAEVTMGEFGDLAAGQFVDLFGVTNLTDSCFEANEVIVEVVSDGS